MSLLNNFTLSSPEDHTVNKREARRFASLRLALDLSVAAFILNYTNSSEASMTQGVIGNIMIGIAIATLFGWSMIMRGHLFYGMGVLIYGLIFGLFSVSLFVNNMGLLVLAILVPSTAQAVSATVPQQRGIQAIGASALVGAAAIIVDIFDRSFSTFRLELPTEISSVLWWVVVLILLIVIISNQRRFTQFAFRTKLIAGFVSVTVVSISLLGILNEARTRATLTANASQALFAAASQSADDLLDFANGNLIGVETEAKLPAIVNYLNLPSDQRSGSPEEAQALATLRVLRAKDEIYISSYAILDLQGNDLLDTDQVDIGSNKADRIYFLVPYQNQETYISDMLISPRSGRPSIYFSAPITDSAANLIGVLRVRYNASILQDIIEDSNDLIGPDSFGVLFDDRLIHMAHGADPQAVFKTTRPISPELFQALVDDYRLPDLPAEELFLDLPDLEMHLNIAATKAGEPEYFTATDVATGNRINQVVAINLGKPSWTLAFFQPEDIFLAPAVAQTNNTILLGIGIAGVVVAAAIYFSQLLVRPITTLTNVAQQVSRGNLAVEAEVPNDDEIGILAKTFNNMTQQLNSLVTNLESQVAARTRDIENRAAQLQAAAEVARDATLETDLQDLFDRAVTLIAERFGFYHVSLYLVDQRDEYAVLVAGSDAAGEQLRESGHRYRVSSESNIGYVTLSGEARIASDHNAVHLVNSHPLLPNSRAQMVLPLKVGDQVLGAIDIHSANPSAFDSSDIAIFSTMADQLAIASQKNQLREESERALSELQTAYGLFTRESWQKFIHTSTPTKGYRYRNLNVEPVVEHTGETAEAWRLGRTISRPQIEDSGTSILAVPLKVRGEVIGILNLEMESRLIPADVTELIEDISARLSLVLENARLVETAQQRVDRERLTNEITEQIRESLDVDTVMQTAVQEIGRALGLDEVEIRLGRTQLKPSNGQQSNGANRDLPVEMPKQDDQDVSDNGQ